MTPSAAEVQSLRERHGVSMIEAKRHLIGRNLRQALMSPVSQASLADVLAVLVDDLYPYDARMDR